MPAIPHSNWHHDPLKVKSIVEILDEPPSDIGSRPNHAMTRSLLGTPEVATAPVALPQAEEDDD